MKKKCGAVIITIIAMITSLLLTTEARSQNQKTFTVKMQEADEEIYKNDTIFYEVYIIPQKDSSLLITDSVRIGALDADSFQVKENCLYFKNKLATGKQIPKEVIFYVNARTKEKFLFQDEETIFRFDNQCGCWGKINDEMAEMIILLKPLLPWN